MKCPNCGKEYGITLSTSYYCFACDMETPLELTNEEWMHEADTEQLAEWIVRIVDCEFCPVKKPCKKQPCKKQIEKWLKQPCKKQIEKWLKQPHTTIKE